MQTPTGLQFSLCASLFVSFELFLQLALDIGAVPIFMLCHFYPFFRYSVVYSNTFLPEWEQANTTLDDKLVLSFTTQVNTQAWLAGIITERKCIDALFTTTVSPRLRID